jgi:hypothetical protein
MAKFDHLKLKARKGLKGAALLELGKINVFCGPNSSGKTTALECINEPTFRAAGMIASPELANSIGMAAFSGRSWANPAFERYYNNALNECITDRGVIFSDEADEIWNLIQASFGGQRGGSGQLDFGGSFKRAFETPFTTPIGTVLIPSKRQLPSATALNASEPIDPAGRGILNFLFRAKNREGASALRKAFDKIAEAFQQISGGFSFETFLRDSSEVELKFRSANGIWLFADDCGMGFRDLLIILY